ncbi:class I SAM-dependent methyltransferase [Bordetella hinzii]|uniref:class I SAM-dependent methyltransferase n=1 Tax=Bordetella hinzii TaxID=103855 RepID=UPI001C02D420|nr:class I SAM-dependent methyltransferase [Bordetella hinzii]
MTPYHPVVLELLARDGAREVLDAPCGTGWLGRSSAGLLLDGVGLWEFPQSQAGYREVREHDLDRPLSLPRRYDAVVCCEAIHLLTNPGQAFESFFRALRPGGRLIVTTPNTWYQRSRLQFLLRGFHSGFRPMVGRRRGEDYITYFAWSFPLLHLLMTHSGYEDIRLHEVNEPKPKRWIEHVLALPSRLYCRRQQRRDPRHAAYWRQAGSAQSLHGRWLVVSARRPGP